MELDLSTDLSFNIATVLTSTQYVQFILVLYMNRNKLTSSNYMSLYYTNVYRF